MDAHERHFLSRYQKPITKFVSGIVQSRYDLIVAISRKAPRLLMLVDQFSNTPIVPWEKCVTEKALPFINATTLSGRRIVVVDDTLIFGSTLAGVMDELSLFNADVHSCVLTISRGAHSELARKVEASMKVREDEIAEFIDSEVQSFGSLGTPYDVDHPIIGITSPTPFEPMLADLKSRRDSMHDNTRRWHAASGVTVFNDDAMSEAKVHSLSSYQRGPCQIRIFIDGKQRHLNVVPIYCLSLTESEMLDTTLFDHSPRPLGVLWRSALQATANSPLHRTRRYQALMNAAHYLGSFEFGWRWITEVLKGIEIDTPSVAERDLRLIFGLDMCTGWQRELRSALAGEMPEPGLPTPEWRDTHRVEIESELLTLARTSSGSKFLSTVNRYLAHTTGAHARESLAAVLEAQRLVWDESTRSSGRLDSSRLDIALSYPAMKQLLELSGVRLTDALFHDCCNSSIDSGLIVPRYVRTTNDENRWVRGIRFGENLSHDHKIKYWLDYVLAQAIMCFKREHRDTAVDGIPWFVCEKLLATLQVGLSAELDNALSVEIALGFDEFGARTTLPEYPRQPFVIDWALETDLFQSDEKRGIRRQSGAVSTGRMLYRNKALSKLFDPTRNPIDRGLLDRTASLVDTFMVLESHLKGPERVEALHALTTCHDESSYLCAISKEIELWLFHPLMNASHLAMSLAELAATAGTQHLRVSAGRLDAKFAESAHLLGETEIKKGSYDRRFEVIRQVDELLSEMGRYGHCMPYWQNTIRPRIDLSPGEHTVRESYLRFAAALAGKAVSIARTVLTENDLVNDRRKPELRTQLKDHLALYNEYIRGAFRRGLSCQLPPEVEPAQLDSGSIESRLENVSLLFERTRTTVLEVWSSWHYPVSEIVIRYFEVDKAVLLWDIKGSSGTREVRPLQEIIHQINRDLEIIATREKAMGFEPDQDDGNGMICDNVSSAIRIFKAIAEKFYDHGYLIRAGIETTMTGEKLWRNSRSGHFGGKPYQLAARLRDFYKEAESQGAKLEYVGSDGQPQQILAPDSAFAVLSDKARLSSESADAEPVPGWLKHIAEAHNYLPRVAGALPLTAYIYSLVEERQTLR